MYRIYIDIETIPRPYTDAELEALLADKVPGQYKKADSIAQWKADNRDAVAAKSSLDPNAGIIACIGYAIDDGAVEMLQNTTSDHAGESAMLLMLSVDIGGSVKQIVGNEWIAHNGNGFDFPYLWRRAVKYGHRDLALMLPHLRYDKSAVDTMQLWGATDYRDMTSLQTIADFLGVPLNKGIDGSDVAAAWFDGRRQAVLGRCSADVAALREIHKRIVGDFERHPMREHNDQTI